MLVSAVFTVVFGMISKSVVTKDTQICFSLHFIQQSLAVKTVTNTTIIIWALSGSRPGYQLMNTSVTFESQRKNNSIANNFGTLELLVSRF